MGTISTAVEGLKWDIKATYEGIAANLNDTLSGIVGNVDATFSGMLHGDVVGINYEEIPNMKNAIREYIQRIDEHLAAVKADADTSNAFKGDYAAQVRIFVEAVCQACGDFISYLLKFNEYLDQVYAKYVQHDEQLSSEIGKQASEVESNFTRYTESN